MRVQQMAVCPLPDGPEENNNCAVPARPKLVCWILARYTQMWSAASLSSCQAGICNRIGGHTCMHMHTRTTIFRAKVYRLRYVHI